MFMYLFLCVREREFKVLCTSEGVLKTKYKGGKSRYIFSPSVRWIFFLHENLQYKCSSQVGAFHSGYLFILLLPLESDVHVL